MSIFNSLGSNYNLRYVWKSLFSDYSGKGQKLKNFLEEKYFGKAILIYKGREALTLVLKILKLPKDSLVAINGFTCFAVYRAIEEAELIPVCLDLESGNTDLNFTPEILEKALKENANIKVVIVQNTFGYPASMEKIRRITREKNIILVEDLAHCVGTVYENGQEAGTIGDFATLSFSQDKVIDSVSGGALIIINKKYFNENKFQLETLGNRTKDKMYPLFTHKIRFFYDSGIGKILHFALKKLNFLSKPMEEGLYKLYSLPDWYCNLALMEFSKLVNQLDHRKEIAKIYSSKLNKRIFNAGMAKMIPASANLRFPIFIENRNNLIAFLKKENIFVSDIWYDSVAPECPNAVDISTRILNLPTHINVSRKSAMRIADKINLWLKSQ